MKSDQNEERAKADLRKILPILAATTKKELTKLCKDLQMTDRGFAMLIWNAALFGLEHHLIRRQWVPSHLAWTPEVSKKLREGPDVAKMRTMRKLMRLSQERRLLVGHLFYTTSRQWHLFYFDQRDMSEETHHWKHGAHIHLLNYLTHPTVSLQDIADELDADRPWFKSEIHIRYRTISNEELKEEQRSDDCPLSLRK